MPSTSSSRSGYVFLFSFLRSTLALLTLYPLQADDELDAPYLAGFEWDKEESWTRLIVHLQKDAGVSNVGGGKKKKKAAADE